MPISKRPSKEFFELLEYTPFPVQLALHKAKEAIRVVCVGRQVGKSEAASVEAVFELIANPGSVGWILAPTYDQAEIIWARVVEKLEQFQTNFKKKYGQESNIELKIQRRRLRVQVLHYGAPLNIAKAKNLKPVKVSEFRGKSADRLDNLRGATLDFAILDEAAMMMANVWTEAVQPMLSTRQGWAMFTSTPKGWNWFYKLFQKGWRGKKVDIKDTKELYGELGLPTPKPTPESELDSDFASFHATSWEVREDVGVQWYLRTKRQLPDLEFRQEYGAEFISHSGSVFTGMDMITRVRYSEPEPGKLVVKRPERGVEYVIGADFGKNQDFSVFAVLDPGTGQIVCLQRTNETSWAKQRRQLKQLALEYNDALVVADTWGIGDVLAEDLTLDGVRLDELPIKSIAAKEDVVNHLNLLMQNSCVILPDSEMIFDELRGFQYHTTPTGKVTMRAVGRGHDDIVIALTLAYSRYTGDGQWMFDPDAKPPEVETVSGSLGDLWAEASQFEFEDELSRANSMFQDTMDF